VSLSQEGNEDVNTTATDLSGPTRPDRPADEPADHDERRVRAMIDALRQGAGGSLARDKDTEQAALRALLGYGEVVDQPGSADPR
jgi:hypothetical protein